MLEGGEYLRRGDRIRVLLPCAQAGKAKQRKAGKWKCGETSDSWVKIRPPLMLLFVSLKAFLQLLNGDNKFVLD